MNNKIYILLAFCLFNWVCVDSVAQVSITDEMANACNDYLYDGNEAGDYSAGMDEVLTICPEAPETILNLYWTTAILGTGDKIVIHDGPDTSFPPIIVNGVGGASGFTGEQLYLLDITSSNPSGCLTIHFTSNSDASVGNFSAIISCGPPCTKPVPTIQVEGEDTSAELLICKDETITFDASGTFFPNNTSFQSVVWDFGDGTTNTTSWPTVDKLFTVPGAYKVNVFVTNDMGCTSVHLLNVIVKVATLPTITAVSEDYYVCVGQEVELSGSVIGTNWNTIPIVDFGGAIYVPDQVGQCFSDTLIITAFANNQVVESLDDIVSFGLNMEHSYIGDLTITVICPDGSSLALHSQGGAGKWLGEPCDNDAMPSFQGNPAYYTFSPYSSNPTLAGTTAQHLQTVTQPCSSGTGSSIIPGDYSAVGDWNALVGCPLNGPWVITICDYLSSDNGYVFGWDVKFNPDLLDDDLSFTPTFGASCDSTYWLGQNIVDHGATCDTVVVVPANPGSQNYTYVAIDNHGCVYSKSINVVAYEGPIISAGDDFYYCGDEVTLQGVVTNPQPSITYTYSWNNAAYLNNANIATPTIGEDAFQETTAFVLSVYPSDDPGCLVRDTVIAIVPAYPPFAMNDSIRICLGETGTLFAPTLDSDNYLYQWNYSPDDVVYVPLEDEINRAIEVGTIGFYQVHVIEPGCHFFSPTTFWVEVIPCDIYAPNIFTPNGDGKNDMFQINAITEYPGSTLVVYNRWGKIVYESKDYRNNWSAEELPEGIYYYIVEINKGSDKEKLAGYFQLVR